MGEYAAFKASLGLNKDLIASVPKLARSVRPLVKSQEERLAAIEGALLAGGQFKEYRHHERPSWAFVHPSTETRGKFRYSIFDRLGWSGHRDGFNTVEDALAAMIGEEWFITPDFGALNRLMTHEAWSLGVRRQALLDRYNFLAMHKQGKSDEALGLADGIAVLGRKIQELTQMGEFLRDLR